MRINLIGALAAVCSIIAFAWTYAALRSRGRKEQLGWLGGFGVLSIPSLWFTAYYAHVLPEYEWFYQLRSWAGSEFLVIFLGGAAGTAASLLPRFALAGPLFVVIACAVIPYIKPLVAPLPDAAFQNQFEGEVCLQSTPSTCGPASVTTILRHFGVPTTERETARAAYTYGGGTEAWYLARFVRKCGLSPSFAFRSTFSSSAGLPAVVGVRVGGFGHFIAVLEMKDGQVTVADPLSGKEVFAFADFLKRYDFTGFHMVIARPQ